MGKVELATKRLINAVWTVAFVRVEGGVKILAHDRTIEEGYEHEAELPRFSFTETDDSKRIVTEMELAPYGPFECWPTEETVTETLKVVNPRNIFSYGSEVPTTEGVYRLVVCVDVDASSLEDAYAQVHDGMSKSGLDWESSDEAFDPDGGVIDPDDLSNARMAKVTP